MVHQISHFLKYDQEELSKVFSSYCTTTSKHGLTDAEFSAVAEMLKKKSKVSGNEDTTFLTSDSAETLLQVRTYIRTSIYTHPAHLHLHIHALPAHASVCQFVIRSSKFGYIYVQTFLNRIISVGPGFVKDILHIIHGKFKDKGKQLQQKVDAIRKNRRNEYSHMTEEQKQEKTEEFEKYKRNMKRLIDLESKVNTHITATFKSLDNDMSKNYMCQTIFLSMDTHRYTEIYVCNTTTIYSHKDAYMHAYR